MGQKGSGITVIIPVYNAEKYLVGCLDSVLSQTFSNLQIIIVDDCSTDSSPEIIRAYASHNKVTAVFNEMNRGAAYCRNKALRLALNEYVGFIDADDYIDSGYYEQLFSEIVRTGADIAVCDFHVTGSDLELFSEATQGGQDAFSFINHGMAASPCNKLFKKEQIEAYPFIEGIMNEDIASVIPALVHAKKICYVPRCYYHYIQHDSSVQNSGLSMKRFDIFRAVDIAIDRIRDVNDYERFRDALFFHQLFMLLIGVFPKERRFGARLKFIRIYCRHIAQRDIDVNKIVRRFFSDHSFKMRAFLVVLLTLTRLRMALVANCAIQTYLLYKRIRTRAPRLVIKPGIKVSDLVEAARLQSGLDDPGIGISVIVPNYNYARYMYQRMYSILSQGIKLREIIILDDHSTDGSREVIESIAKAVGPYVPVITAFNNNNSGSAFLQWRKGISMASGDYIWIAEADDYSEPEMLEKLAEPVRRDRSITLSYCNTAFMDSGGYLLPVDVLKMIDLMHTGHWKKSYVNDGVNEIMRYAFLNCTISNVSSVLFKADAAADINEITTYKQAGDWLFYTMLMGKGKIAYNSEILNYYRMHGGNVSNTTDKVDALKEIIRVHKAIEQKYGLSNRQKRCIQKRYAFLMKVWKIKGRI